MLEKNIKINFQWYNNKNVFTKSTIIKLKIQIPIHVIGSFKKNYQYSICTDFRGVSQKATDVALFFWTTYPQCMAPARHI